MIRYGHNKGTEITYLIDFCLSKLQRLQRWRLSMDMIIYPRWNWKENNSMLVKGASGIWCIYTYWNLQSKTRYVDEPSKNNLVYYILFTIYFCRHNYDLVNTIIRVYMIYPIWQRNTIMRQVTEQVSLIARFMGLTWGPSGTDRTQVDPCWPHEHCYLRYHSWSVQESQVEYSLVLLQLHTPRTCMSQRTSSSLL